MPVQYCGPPQDGGLAVSSIIDRLRRQTKEKRIPVLAFFKGFDALKLKRINKQQFVRGLSSAALQVRALPCYLLLPSLPLSPSPAHSFNPLSSSPSLPLFPSPPHPPTPSRR